MTIIQAAILGIVFGVARMGILYTWPKWSALFGSMIIGIVMGKLPEAMMMGAALQSIYLGIIMPGGNIPTDETLATFVAIPIALQNNLTPEIAVTLAVPVGLLGVALDYIKKTGNAAWIHLADKAAEKGYTKALTRNSYLYPVLMLVGVYMLPVGLAIYFGPNAVETVMNAIPQWVITGLSIAGGILPALGFALTINTIGKINIIPYFIVGFFLRQFAPDVNTIAMAIFGLFFAYLHVMFSKDDEVQGGVLQ